MLLCRVVRVLYGIGRWKEKNDRYLCLEGIRICALLRDYALLRNRIPTCQAFYSRLYIYSI